MQEALEFARSDGDPSRWPVCGKPVDGQRWERLESNGGPLAQYLEKLSVQLRDHFGWPRNSHPSLSLLHAH